MIKIENVEVGGLKPALRGMRNPKNSWAKSDSGFGCTHRKNWNKEEDSLLLCENCGHTYDDHVICAGHQQYCMGPNDHDLATRLRNAGTDHRKYLRIPDEVMIILLTILETVIVSALYLIIGWLLSCFLYL